MTEESTSMANIYPKHKYLPVKCLLSMAEMNFQRSFTKCVLQQKAILNTNSLDVINLTMISKPQNYNGGKEKVTDMWAGRC